MNEDAGVNGLRRKLQEQRLLRRLRRSNARASYDRLHTGHATSALGSFPSSHVTAPSAAGLSVANIDGLGAIGSMGGARPAAAAAAGQPHSCASSFSRRKERPHAQTTRPVLSSPVSVGARRAPGVGQASGSSPPRARIAISQLDAHATRGKCYSRHMVPRAHHSQ